MNKKVGVLILGYNSIGYLKKCFNSLQIQDFKKISIFYGDNGSNDKSVTFVKKNYPNIKTFDLKINNGYAKGNNLLLKIAFDQGMDLCFILNPDTILKKNTISSLVDSYIKHSDKGVKVGLTQPVILLNQDKTRINTIGNAVHLLGFGFCKDYMRKYSPIKKDKEILSVSGTGMLISKELYKGIGGFDEDFFMYSEDEDLSIRSFLSGYKNILASKSVMYHNYLFSKNKNKWFYSERNRLLIMLKNYPVKLLLFLAVPFFITEIFVLIYSLSTGWFLQKIKSYADVIKKIIFGYKKRKPFKIEKNYLKMLECSLNFKPIHRISVIFDWPYILYKNFLILFF
jgi:GT2 family glycosyltransferase